LARLIENPDESDGAPPYALTDQTGTVQRYVEPVPGIDLAAYVGQVVAVRHDTGQTLLASQLELPPQPLRSATGNAARDRYAAIDNSSGSSRQAADSHRMVEQVQYVDDDDSSVELLPDDVSISDSDGSPAGSLRPLEGPALGGDFPVYPDQMGPRGFGGPPYGMPYGGPMSYGPGMMEYPEPMTGPCPNCGRYHNFMYGPDSACGEARGNPPPDRAHLSADVELMLLRPSVAENAIGKFSEQLQFSPRIVLGLRGAGNLDGRVRYWHYNRDSDILGTDDEVRVKFDVLDIEALHRFEGRRSELTLSGGVRLAGVKLTDTEDEKSGADYIGLTLAGDGLTPLGRFRGGHFGLVYGGRVAILDGDWGGDDNSLFINQQSRNDNMFVHELYGGVELARRFRVVNVRARLLFEAQNWKSDVLADEADIESIGFFGPGLEIGAEF
jgi:hypothetical protein